MLYVIIQVVKSNLKADIFELTFPVYINTIKTISEMSAYFLTHLQGVSLFGYCSPILWQAPFESFCRIYKGQ
jgi:hypothetical protein